MNTSEHFYRDIPECYAMVDVFNKIYSRAVPIDWLLVMTDVVQSTQAIEAGRYKDVNIAGGLAVMAIANLIESMDFPFIFGGDGVTLLIPNQLEQAVRAVLIDTRDKIALALDLQLRIALVPIKTLYQQGYQLRVAKLRLSTYYTQAIIEGDALEIAESWLKAPSENNPFLIISTKELAIVANFNGFSCRWQDIPSEKGEIITLIVKFRTQDALLRQQELTALLAFLREHYGQESDYHPIQIKQMRSGGLKLLRHEMAIRTAGYSWLIGLRLAISIMAQFTLMRCAQLLAIPIHLHWVDVLHLKEMNKISADFRKFDGTLKMVISGTTANRTQLMSYLNNAYQQGRFFYGIHVSDRALLTCLMHLDSKSEVHFVDGADGGYTMAAKQLKAQIRQ